MSTVELRHLIYFDAVVRHGGFTRAAEELHVAQPSVSTQIRQLERMLGVELLVRSTRRVSLTPAGESLLRRAHRILDELEAARHEMTAHATALSGHLRVGVTAVVGDLPLADLLARYRRTYPGVSVELSCSLIGELLDRLATAELDVVVGPEHAPDSRFTSQPVACERFVLITSPDDERTVTSLRQVAAEPFICLPRSSGLHQILTRAAQSEGFTPDISVTTHSPQSIRELVSAGMGVAMVAESCVRGPGRPVRAHRLASAPHHPRISVFRARGRTDPSVLALYDLLAGAAHQSARLRQRGS